MHHYRRLPITTATHVARCAEMARLLSGALEAAIGPDTIADIASYVSGDTDDTPELTPCVAPGFDVHRCAA